MPSLTVYPQLDGDAEAGGLLTDTTWSALHDAANADAITTSGTTVAIRLRGSPTTNQYRFIRRAFLSFDVSSLGASAVVSAADLELVATSRADSLGGARLVVARAALASVTSLAVGDYDGVERAALAPEVEWSALVVDSSTYTTISLDGNGVGYVHNNRTGSVVLALMAHWDFHNTPPPWSNVSSTLSFYSADEGEPGEVRPRLVITYTTPTPASSRTRPDWR